MSKNVVHSVSGQMPRLFVLALAVVISAAASCRPSGEELPEEVDVSAIDLHRAFRTDADSARAEFNGKDLFIVGEVARAFPRFRGTTMSGEVTTPPKVMLVTELDTLPTDIKYVQVEGEFDVPDSLELWAVDPRIREGENLRVSCPDAAIRWSDPGLYISDCRIAAE